jgi:hypothetical protein
MPLLLSLLLIPPCANIAILTYARNVTRTQEFAARYVLGAGRGRIIAQLFMEALLLTACAGCVALVLTQKLLEWARAYASEDSELRNVVPYWMKPALSLESVLYVAGSVLLAAMIAGGIPALRATGRIAQSGFQGLGARTSGQRLGRTWTVLVALQVCNVNGGTPSSHPPGVGSAQRGDRRPGLRCGAIPDSATDFGRTALGRSTS